MERAFVDTSAWVAYVDAKDERHRAVKRSITKWKDRLVTTNFVLDETVTLCRYDCGHDVAVRVAERLTDGRSVELVRVTAEDEARALDLLRKRADKEYSFTDCTSFVVMRRLGMTRAITTDSDFQQEGFESLP
jgi:hypothetical protein